MATRSSSDVGSILWINPKKIKIKISPVSDLIGNVGGDWDIERRHDVTKTAKYRAIVQRFVAGRRWEETDLFTDAYTRRLAKDGHIGGVRSLAALAKAYEARFDVMVDEFNRRGFQLTGPDGRPHALPAFLVGRDGDVFIGNQGNHRLAIAQVLGLDTIAGRVVCRHL